MDYIAEPLRTLAVPIAELHEDPSNARKGHAVDRIAASLKQYGQRKPIVVNRAQGGKVEAGNGTLAAAKSLGWTHIAAVFVDDDAATAAAYGIADNRVGEFSEWDADILSDLMPTLDGMFTGFLPKELDAILPAKTTEGDTEPQVDRADELRQKWGVESGQMWRLGEHRIICGDCTDAATVARVMGGERADMVFTDPPYNVDYGADNQHHPSWGKKWSKGAIANDNMSASDWEAFQARWLEQTLSVLDGAIYICMSSKEWASTRQAFVCAGGHWSSDIIWVKDRFVLGRKDYHSRYEAMLYGWVEGRSHHWGVGRDKDDVWEIKRNATNDLHPTMKPLELVQTALAHASPESGIVYEPFSGSGTTIIACENLGRKCRAVEISPAYVAVAIERWATHTGGTPELLP